MFVPAIFELVSDSPKPLKCKIKMLMGVISWFLLCTKYNLLGLLLILARSLRLKSNQMAVLCGMPTMQYSARSARFFKLNDLHISTSLSSVITDMARDSIVDNHCLCQRYVPYAIKSRPTSQKNLGKFLVRSVQATGMTLS